MDALYDQDDHTVLLVVHTGIERAVVPGINPCYAAHLTGPRLV